MLVIRSCLKLTIIHFFVADFMLDASEEYGNIYQLRLLTDNRVRDYLLSIK